MCAGLFLPFTARKYSSIRSFGRCFAAAQSDTLQWRIDTLHLAAPRSVAFCADSPAAAYAGAQRRGRLLAMLFLPRAERPRVAHTRIPAWMRCDDL